MYICALCYRQKAQNTIPELELGPETMQCVIEYKHLGFLLTNDLKNSNDVQHN